MPPLARHEDELHPRPMIRVAPPRSAGRGRSAAVGNRESTAACGSGHAAKRVRPQRVPRGPKGSFAVSSGAASPNEEGRRARKWHRRGPIRANHRGARPRGTVPASTGDPGLLKTTPLYHPRAPLGSGRNADTIRACTQIGTRRHTRTRSSPPSLAWVPRSSAASPRPSAAGARGARDEQGRRALPLRERGPAARGAPQPEDGHRARAVLVLQVPRGRQAAHGVRRQGPGGLDRSKGRAGACPGPVTGSPSARTASTSAATPSTPRTAPSARPSTAGGAGRSRKSSPRHAATRPGA